MIKTLLLAAVLAASVVAAGCGGGEENAAAAKAEFLTSVRAVCKLYEGRKNQVRFPRVNPVSPKTSHRDRAVWGLALKQIVQIGREEVKVLRSLEPPEQLKARFDRLLTEMDASLDLLEQGAAAATRNKPAQVRSKVTKARAVLARVASIATKLGAKACG